MSSLGWDIRSVSALRYICEITKCNIVISSTWRLDYQHVINCLKSCSYPKETIFNVIGHTGFKGNSRGEQIKGWLEEHPQITNYVILDDDNDMLVEQQERFVQTSYFGNGLTQELAEDAVRILGGCSDKG